MSTTHSTRFALSKKGPYQLSGYNYRPSHYPGRVTLIRARTFALRERVVPDRGWASFAESVDVRVVKGDHASILKEPRVRELAAALAETLEPESHERQATTSVRIRRLA